MIFRLLALLALPVAAWYAVGSLSRRFSLNARQRRILFVIAAALLTVGALVVLGRLPAHFVLAPLGAAGAFLLRFLPALLRLLPFWQLVRGRMASAAPRGAGRTSTIRTAFLAMELRHDTGELDGEVLKGASARRRLGAMDRSELLALYEECRADADSARVLEAYLDRTCEGWREQAEAAGAADEGGGDPVMTRELALEILGLDGSAGDEDVGRAHRDLMRRMHPDRGGSDYLAKRINAAKDFLLKRPAGAGPT